MGLFSKKQDLGAFARQASRSQATISIPLRRCQELANALEHAIVADRPSLVSKNPRMLVVEHLQLACPSCGCFTHDGKLDALMSSAGGLYDRLGKAAIAGPGISSLRSGRCPGCHGSQVIATFDPKGL